MHFFFRTSLLLLTFSATNASAQVPEGHIPGAILMEVSLLERSFDAALADRQGFRYY